LTWVLPIGVRGRPDAVRLSASLLDRREGQCGDFAALKARPQVFADTSERRRYPPWQDFALGVVMAALDAVEFKGADAAPAVEEAISASRSPLHDGAAVWVRNAVHCYLEGCGDLELDLKPDSRQRVVQHVSGRAVRMLTAWGRWYVSGDGGVVEFRRLRFGAPRGTSESPSTWAIAFLAAVGVVIDGDLYREMPVTARDDTSPAQRVRVVEIGLADGHARLLVDCSPQEARRGYREHGQRRAAELVDGGGRVPGADCAECKLLYSCEALPRTPGLLGLADEGTHRRVWSITTARQYATCPAQAHLRDLHLPTPDADNPSARRGRLVHEWLEVAHQRGVRCSPGDLPGSGGLGVAGEFMTSEDYREARPYLLAHLSLCPLPAEGVVTEARLAAYDTSADVLVIANPDLLREVGGVAVYREQKTTVRVGDLDCSNGLERYPQLALAVCLIADGALGGGSGGFVELEVLAPEEGALLTFDVGDPAVVARARRVVNGQVRDWHHDVSFTATPGPWCASCPVARWCPDRLVSEGPVVVDGVTIDPRTGEILAGAGAISDRAAAVAAGIADPAEDEEPPF
jgi:PD-(D/E)XK nuclease superfamily